MQKNGCDHTSEKPTFPSSQETQNMCIVFGPSDNWPLFNLTCVFARCGNVSVRMAESIVQPLLINAEFLQKVEAC